MSAPTSLHLPVTHAYRSLAELLAAGSAERVPVLTLTDEELTVLSGADAEQLAPRPWWRERADDDHELVQAVALRSLAARGLVVPGTADARSGEADLVIHDVVLALLAARRASSAVVLAERRTSQDSSFKALYVQGELGVIEEEVSPGGLHHFSAAGAGDCGAGLATFANPEAVGDASASDRDSRTVDLVEVAAGRASIEKSGAARVVTVLTVVTPSTPERGATVFAHDDALEWAAPSDTAARLEVTQVSPAGLVDRITRLIASALGTAADG